MHTLFFWSNAPRCGFLDTNPLYKKPKILGSVRHGSSTQNGSLPAWGEPHYFCYFPFHFPFIRDIPFNIEQLVCLNHTYSPLTFALMVTVNKIVKSLPCGNHFNLIFVFINGRYPASQRLAGRSCTLQRRRCKHSSLSFCKFSFVHRISDRRLCYQKPNRRCCRPVSRMRVSQRRRRIDWDALSGRTLRLLVSRCGTW